MKPSRAWEFSVLNPTFLPPCTFEIPPVMKVLQKSSWFIFWSMKYIKCWKESCSSRSSITPNKHRNVRNGRRVGTADLATAWSHPVSPEQVLKVETLVHCVITKGHNPEQRGCKHINSYGKKLLIFITRDCRVFFVCVRKVGFYCCTLKF